MSRPLKDIVAELEGRYPRLLYDLQERSRIIEDFESDMDEMLLWIERYEKNIRFVLERKLDVDIVKRSTLNLALVMQHFGKSLFNYDYAINMYLLDDRYEKNHDLWSTFIDTSTRLQKLFDRMFDVNVFEVDRPNEMEVYSRFYYGEELPKDMGFIVNLESDRFNELNGAELIIFITFFLKCFDYYLNELKNSGLKWWDCELKYFYEENYLLFAKRYWPKYEDGFRQHISKQRLRNNITINGLEKQRDELIHDFEYNSVAGRIWRDYSENIPQMVLQMRSQKINENQWEYFFKTIFEIEEFDRWIDELRNPPESEEDKQKRVRLLASNNIFNLKPGNQHKEVDILLLYQFIDYRFIEDEAVMHTYDWFALYYVLMKNDLITTCSIEDFARQMNDKEWFEDAERKCSAKEIKKYCFLLDIEPQKWIDEFDKLPYHISKNSIFSIYSKWYMMNDIMDEVIERQQTFLGSDKTIIVNGNYYDIHNNNTVNL